MQTCEMIVNNFFQLSSGHIVLTGIIIPDIQTFILKCKADLYINGEKAKELSIIGEDRFSGCRNGQKERAIRTDSDIINVLKKNLIKDEIKLIIPID